MKKTLALILTGIVIVSFCACNLSKDKKSDNSSNINQKNNSKIEQKIDKSNYITQTKDATKSTLKPTITKTLTVKDENYRIDIFGSSQICATQIEIYNEKVDAKTPTQIFAFTGTASMLSLEFGFETIDINFDGDMDFRIISSDGQDALGTIKYQNYVWDNDLKKFYNKTELDKISNVKADITKKILSFKSMETAFSGTTGFLQFIDEKLVLVEQTSQVIDPTTNKFKITKRALKDNKLQTVSETESDTSIFK